MNTPTAPIPTISSIEAGLTLLVSSLVLGHRTDGTEYPTKHWRWIWTTEDSAYLHT